MFEKCFQINFVQKLLKCGENNDMIMESLQVWIWKIVLKSTKYLNVLKYGSGCGCELLYIVTLYLKAEFWNCECF